ncbi:flagellar assembly peptidoglycan hydrolase FlgJ [Chitinimonas lacunae]|uniref:Peptidoglycan hydrolase FlgJ n=1 Tax=Chitinimonas lacunae TaxID=1963018 RepID=A0ABV8MI17_9NEIS
MQAFTSLSDSRLTSKFALDSQSVGDLRAKLGRDPQGATREVAEQFEALFVDMMMKAMREATPKFDELESESVGFFRGMYDQQLSQTFAGGRGLGFADLIERQINQFNEQRRSVLPIIEPPTSSEAGKPPAMLAAPAAAPAIPSGPAKSSNAEQFIAEVGEHAVDAARSLGVSPHLLLAHAALESGWGRRPIVNEAGQNSHNLFGIKAGRGWQGKTAEIVTTEYVDGVAQKRVERFRAYDSYDEAFADYARLLNQRYGEVVGAPDAKAFAGELQQGGYATDPQYAAKLTRVAEHRALRAYRTV